MNTENWKQGACVNSITHPDKSKTWLAWYRGKLIGQFPTKAGAINAVPKITPREKRKHLNAAAPAMLSTLQDILCWLTAPDLSKDVIEAYREDCRCAIAKAKGLKP